VYIKLRNAFMRAAGWALALGARIMCHALGSGLVSPREVRFRILKGAGEGRDREWEIDEEEEDSIRWISVLQY
jgi:hypothetical protein